MTPGVTNHRLGLPGLLPLSSRREGANNEVFTARCDFCTRARQEPGRQMQTRGRSNGDRGPMEGNPGVREADPPRAGPGLSVQARRQFAQPGPRAGPEVPSAPDPIFVYGLVTSIAPQPVNSHGLATSTAPNPINSHGLVTSSAPTIDGATKMSRADPGLSWNPQAFTLNVASLYH